MRSTRHCGRQSSSRQATRNFGRYATDRFEIISRNPYAAFTCVPSRARTGRGEGRRAACDRWVWGGGRVVIVGGGPALRDGDAGAAAPSPAVPDVMWAVPPYQRWVAPVV